MIIFFIILIITMLFVFVTIQRSTIKKSFRGHNLKYYKKMAKNANEEIKNFRRGTINEIKHYKSYPNPKISVIIPTHNGENYIISCLMSIQNQNFDDIEIIIVDDNSKDRTVEIINSLKSKDERIVFIKNEKINGTLTSRREGVTKAKGKYILFIDQDDFFINDIFNYTYNYNNNSKEEFDIIEIQSFEGYKSLEKPIFGHKYEPYYQPELSLYMFYDGNTIGDFCSTLWGKLFKRDVIIKAYEYMGSEYSNKYMVLNEERLLLFSIAHVAKNMIFLDYPGYFHYQNLEGTGNSKKTKSLEKIHLTFNDYFIYLKFIFEHTRKRSYEKAPCSHFFIYTKWYLENEVKNLYEGFDFYNKVFEMYLNSWVISSKDKDIIRIFYNKIKKREIEVKEMK